MAKVVFHPEPPDAKYVICSWCGCPVLDVPEDLLHHKRHHGVIEAVHDVPLPDRDAWTAERPI